MDTGIPLFFFGNPVLALRDHTLRYHNACTWKSGLLFAISAKMQPIDQMSTGHEYLLAPKRISGALYHRVTTS